MTVTPNVGLAGGQDVSMVVSGLEPGHTAGRCQRGIDPPVVDPSYCGANTTFLQTVDANGEIRAIVHLQRFIYIPALGRWVDCTEETCILGAADSADIGGTAAFATLSFAPPPPPPTTRGTIELLAAGADGIPVRGTGFRPGAAIDVFECQTGADHPSGCGFAKASTTADASGGFLVTVAPDPFVEPAGGTRVNCIPLEAQACSIVAAEAVDFPGTEVGVPLPVPPPIVTPGVGSVVEGNSGSTDLQVPVNLSNASALPVTVQWTTVYVAGAPEPWADPATDYTAASGTVTFAPGETAKTVTIAVSGDTLVEPDEYVAVSFHDPTNASMGGVWGLGFGVITNDDHATVVPGSGIVAAPSSGTADLAVGVTLSNPSTQTITVQWNTLFTPGAPADPWLGPQAPTSDYIASSGTVTFAPGQTTAEIHIPVLADSSPGPDEHILISFNHPTNANMGGFWGLGFGIITPAP